MAQTITIALNTTAQTAGINATMRGLAMVKDGVESVGRRFVTLSNTILRFAAPLTAALSGAAMARSVKSSIDLADNLAKTAQQAGMSVRQFSALAYAGNLNRATQEQLSKGSQKLSEWLAKTGQSGRDLTEALLEQSDVIAGMVDGDEKLMHVRRVFGEEGQKLIPLLNQGSAALRAQMLEAEQLGVVIGDQFAGDSQRFNDNLTRIRAGLRGVFNRIAEELLPKLNEITDGIVGWAKENSERIATVVRESVQTMVGAWEQGRLGELLGLTLEVGVEASLNRIGKAIETTVTGAFDRLFSSEFVVISAKAGKALAHALLTAVKLPVDFLSASLDWLVITTGDQFTKMFAAVGRVAMDVFVGSVNVLIQALNKVPGFRGKFAELGTEDFGGIDKMLRSLEAGADGGSFGDMFAAASERSAEAIQTVVRYLDQQIQATEKILEQGDLRGEQIDKEISALERLKKLRDQILNHTPKPGAPGADPVKDSAAEQVEKRRGFIAALKDEVIKFDESFTASFQKLEAEFTSVADGIAHTLVNGIGAAIDTVAFGLWSVIDGTATWGDLFRNVARNMISDLIRVGLQEVALLALKKTVGAAWGAFMSMMRGKDVAEANATEAAKAPALAGNALLASIGSWGIAVAVGVAAIAAILASVGAFQEGGIVHGGQQLIRVNEAGTEAVLNAQATSMLGENTINALNRGVMPEGGIAGAQSLAAAGTPAASSGRPTSLNVAFFDNRDQVRQWAESSAGQMWFIEMAKRNKTEIGIP